MEEKILELHKSHRSDITGVEITQVYCILLMFVALLVKVSFNLSC